MASDPLNFIDHSRKEGLLGPWVASTVASSFVTGIIVCQATTYYSLFEEDRAMVKWTVSASLFLNAISFVFDAWAIWLQTIPQNAIANLSRPLWPAVANILPIVMIASISQIFFGHRAWGTTGKRRSIVALFGIMIFLTFCNGVALIPIKLSVTNPTFLLCLQSWLWMTSATDITITSFLVVAIRRQQQGFNKRTDALLTWLLKSSLSTAAIVSIIAITDASLSLADINNAHLPFTHLLPRVYTASVLFVLNSRAELRGIHSTGGAVGSTCKSSNGSIPLKVRTTSGRSVHNDGQVVHIQTNVAVVSERDENKSRPLPGSAQVFDDPNVRRWDRPLTPSTSAKDFTHGRHLFQHSHV